LDQTFNLFLLNVDLIVLLIIKQRILTNIYNLIIIGTHNPLTIFAKLDHHIPTNIFIALVSIHHQIAINSVSFTYRRFLLMIVSTSHYFLTTRFVLIIVFFMMIRYLAIDYCCILTISNQLFIQIIIIKLIRLDLVLIIKLNIESLKTAFIFVQTIKTVQIIIVIEIIGSNNLRLLNSSC